MVDTYRGQMRLRAWPRKRGTPKSAAVRLQNTWFKKANDQTKRVAGQQMALAIRATKGTGLYPRDVLLRGMGAGFIDIQKKDGTLVTYRQAGVDDVAFQGAILSLTAPLGIPAGTLVSPTWPLPLIDTAGLWSVANANRLTVPAGVSIMNFMAATYNPANIAGLLVLTLRLNGVLEVARSGINVTGFKGECVQTGPIVVTPGDWWEFLIFSTFATTAPAGGLTTFQAEILQAP